MIHSNSNEQITDSPISVEVELPQSLYLLLTKKVEKDPDKNGLSDVVVQMLTHELQGVAA